jgi:iron complex outermembrane receptor protein
LTFRYFPDGHHFIANLGKYARRELFMKLHFKCSAVAAAVYALLGSGYGLAWAQPSNSDPEHRLEEVTITARTLESDNLMVPAQQLSGAALTQRQGSTLGETLDNLPGIANSSFGPNVGRPVIRGMDGDRIRILQNSGANMDMSALSNDHAVPIDPLTTERIEVLRGPATLLYGGSAIGGVVNVIDNRIARERSFDAKGGVMGKAEVRAGGAANERSTGAMVETGNDKIALHVDAFDRTTQNLQVPKDMSCGEGNSATPNGRRLCNSASNSKGAAVGGTILFDRGYLGLSTSEYRSTYGTVAEPTVHIGMVRRRDEIEGLLSEVGTFQNVKFQLGHTNYTHTEFETPDAASGTRFDNKGYDLRLEGRQRPIALSNGMQLQGVVGVQNERSDVQARDDQGVISLIPPSRTHSTGVFTYQALKTSWGQLSAGARAESVSVQSFEASGPSAEIPAQTQKFKPMSFSLGAMRNLRQGEAQNGWQLTTNLSASQRAPKDYELFAHGEHAATGTYEIGQPNIGLEKGTQLDVGGEWKQGAHKFAITGFASQFSNYISLQPTGNQNAGLPEYAFQGVRARFYGIESTVKIRMVGGQDAVLTPNSERGAIDLELRADVVRAQDLTNNAPMPRIAPMRFGTDVIWSRQAWGARFGFMSAAAQNRVPNNDTDSGVTTAGYILWNAGLNYHLHSGPTHWLLFAKLDNITNKLAYSPTSVLTQTMGENAPPLAGRSLKVGAQVGF